MEGLIFRILRYSGTEIVPCRLLLWMARIGMDWNVKKEAYFSPLMLCLHKSPKHSTLSPP